MQFNKHIAIFQALLLQFQGNNYKIITDFQFTFVFYRKIPIDLQPGIFLLFFNKFCSKIPINFSAGILQQMLQ